MFVIPSKLWYDARKTLTNKGTLFGEKVEDNPNRSFYQSMIVWSILLIFSALVIISVIAAPFFGAGGGGE